MRQFIRNARLRVGTKGTLEKEYVGFRLNFKFDKNLESSPNTGIINIYNLSQESREKFEAKNAICSLDVGYGNELLQLFSGNIAKATTRKSGIDRITEIELGDGEKAYQEAKIDLTFPPGATADQIIQKVAFSFKDVVSGGVNAIREFIIPKFKSYGTGVILSGTAKDILDSLTKTVGMEWSIQDGELQIIEQQKPTNDESVFLSPTTGLIGSPGKIKADAGKNIPDGGIEFQCLLQPKLKPGRLIEIESELISGVYRISKVTHEGDNFAGNWVSKCEAYVHK